MNQKCVDKLIGKYCKIVTKEPGDEKSYVVVGTVKDVDHNAGFITIESTQGLSCLSINTIIAIKPKAKTQDFLGYGFLKKQMFLNIDKI